MFFKISKVSPVHCCPFPSPIAVLSPFAKKILERLVYKQLNYFLEKGKTFYLSPDLASGKIIPEQAIFELTDNLKMKTDSNETIYSISLDLSKAFDTVNHQIILQKLYRYGIRGGTPQLYIQKLKLIIMLLIHRWSSTKHFSQLAGWGWNALLISWSCLVCSNRRIRLKTWSKAIKIIISLQFRLLVFANHVCAIIASNTLKGRPESRKAMKYNSKNFNSRAHMSRGRCIDTRFTSYVYI